MVSQDTVGLLKQYPLTQVGRGLQVALSGVTFEIC